jgi:hypothetical protein
VGSVKDVKELLSALPLTEVTSLEVSRMGAAGVIKVAANGSEFKLETRPVLRSSSQPRSIKQDRTPSCC